MTKTKQKTKTYDNKTKTYDDKTLTKKTGDNWHWIFERKKKSRNKLSFASNLYLERNADMPFLTFFFEGIKKTVHKLSNLSHSIQANLATTTHCSKVPTKLQ